MKFLLYLSLGAFCISKGFTQANNFPARQNQSKDSQNQNFQSGIFYVGDSSGNAGNLRSTPQPKLTNQQSKSSIYSQFFGSGEQRTKSRDSFLNFYYTTYQQARNNPLIKLRQFSRKIDGSENNIGHPKYGSAKQTLLRKGIAKYQDGISTPYKYQKTPREISNYLGVMDKQMELAFGGRISMLFTIWGQFIDHDITLTETVETEKMNIPIPWCDQFMDVDCGGGKYIEFKRSKYDQNSIIRNQINQITAWIDASQIYGSNQLTAKQLRTFSGGQLRVTEDNLLPSIIEKGYKVFHAGDIRANQNVILTTFHTVFVRQHNRVCQQIQSKQKSFLLTDEQIYQIGRNYVIALIQKITFDDFLPILMGKVAFKKYIGQYRGYNSNINPNVMTEFSTAAFRTGHSLLVHKYKYMDKNKKVIQQFLLRELFFRPDLINNESMVNFIRGAKYTPCKKKDARVIDEVRNSLISGPDNREIRLDLFSLNIQRSKDHGLPYQNQIRLAYGMPKIRSFREMLKDQNIIRKLQILYETPDHCDLWIAIIAQDSADDGILGELGAHIVGQQFRNIRNGDRFWYEQALPQQIIKEIKNTTIEDIFARNIGLQREGKNIFYIEKEI